MNALMKIVKKYKLILVEILVNLWVQLIKIVFGNFWQVWYLFFYVSHQLIAGEGGMLVCNKSNDYKITYS